MVTLTALSVAAVLMIAGVVATVAGMKPAAVDVYRA